MAHLKTVYKGPKTHKQAQKTKPPKTAPQSHNKTSHKIHTKTITKLSQSQQPNQQHKTSRKPTAENQQYKLIREN